MTLSYDVPTQHLMEITKQELRLDNHSSFVVPARRSRINGITNIGIPIKLHVLFIMQFNVVGH